MAIPSIVAKVTLAVLGAGALSAGIAIPLSQNQNTDSSSEIAPSSPVSPAESPSKPLDKETFTRLSGDERLENCYSFASAESNSSPLLLFCSKGNDGTSVEGNFTFKFWDGEELKTATSLIKQEASKKTLVGLGSDVGEAGEIDIEDEDILDHEWNFISLSNCSIESETRILGDRDRVLTCTYVPEEDDAEGDLETPKQIFLLEKFDFSKKKGKIE
ncbi:hypothetical protein WEN_02265 [Mycoplasma wenyonii str. Massachusetts]|uniref:Uncharacterized protein n=1 Tax=Mycoplasma wenyonii (strain Massachusetts) TaxID=1197325 RepID=I6ZJ70_MYCWM|nr:hypothetical protein [Mycoplasma wenyonii]AFN65240.1 hypothetical protein WEN_02265 [Mycoplasma wenyonii str. Massachusetts]